MKKSNMKANRIDILIRFTLETVMTEWNHILLHPEYAPEEPDEILVKAVKLLRKRRALKILDLGCGAGRHVVYMASQTFEAYGVDASETGLKKTKERLQANNLNAFLVRCDMKFPPFTDSYFDVVICLNTIYHQRLKEIQQTISEAHRILKNKGLFLVNFHSKRSHRYGKGVKVEENTLSWTRMDQKKVCFTTLWTKLSLSSFSEISE
jgi:ubiquinone/menaquinone biosynthesis C-methylase UbiE